MVADQEDNGGSRPPEAKNGATVTLLGEAIGQHLAGQKAMTGKQVDLFDQGDQLPDDDQAGDGKREPGKPGRPPGAQNKATEAFRRFVRSRYGDPLLKLMERAFADPKVLAAALNAPVGDVWQRQNDILLRLLPYLHSQMPAELKVASSGFFGVAISAAPGGPAGDQLLEAENPFARLLQYAKENQGLSLPVVGQSYAEQSDAEPHSLTPSKG